ncbi:MAG TPA: adenylate/guanylate cyclase domain-containing protein [Acidimicrobiales bacterium]|nr:adenylate/guanylate cyclase domain-containing protein [Acidimicrobiales bacterium]
MSDAPQTVTFLFSDIESSTQRWDRDGVGMSAALAVHDEVMRATITAHRGEVFKHTGDGVCAVFHSATDAARAAVEVQQRVALPVRIGMHTGEAETRDGDWYGSTVNLAARIMDAGHGGQILSSAVTASMLPAHTALKVLGEHRLKGLDRAEAIVQVGPGEFAPLRAPTTMITLPERRRSLVGRHELLRRVESALTAGRLVTLVGPGGVGKTSVAIEAARRGTGLVDRTAFVDLTTVDGASGVPVAVARALGLSTAELPAIRLAIASGSTLLVVDNCEHVVDAAAEVVQDLLGAAGSGVRVVATSRESLELDGETVLSVPPLTDDDAMIELFLDRAAAAGASRLKVDDRPRVAELCRRLDGLPLAIELAASRCTVLTVEQILAHLDQRLELLSSGRRRGRERHRTLRETIDWSYELLGERERDLYRRLAIFVDWFALDDAAAVAGGASEMEVLDVLEGLVARSLLVVSEVAGEAHYRYLESIRDHAWELLDRGGHSDGLMVVLSDHLAAKLATLAIQVWDGPDGDALEEMGRLVIMQRHAAGWCITSGELERATRLLLPYAHVLPNGYAPAFDVAERLALAVTASGQRDGEALMLHLVQLTYQREFRAYHEAMPRILDALDAEMVSPTMMAGLFFLSAVAGDETLAARLPTQACRVEGGLGSYLQLWEQPAMDVDELLTLSNSMPTRTGTAGVLARACSLAQEDAPDRVEELADRILSLCPEGSSGWTAAWLNKAGARLRIGAFTEALECAHVATNHARTVGELSILAPVTALHALVLWKLGVAREAALVRGAAPRRWSIFFQRERDELDLWLANRFTQAELRVLAAEGRKLNLDDLLSIAPAALAASTPTLDPAQSQG